MMLTDVLGRERLVTRTYPDGSFDCPFCATAVIAPLSRDDNPWCPASTYALADPASADTFRQQIAEHEAQKQREAERKRNHEQVMRQIADERRERDAWVDAQYAEARKRGTCVRCLRPAFYGRRAQFIQHRGTCPREESKR